LKWILANESGNGRNTNDLRETFYKLLSEEDQSKATELRFILLKGQILEQSIDAVGRIGS